MYGQHLAVSARLRCHRVLLLIRFTRLTVLKTHRDSAVWLLSQVSSNRTHTVRRSHVYPPFIDAGLCATQLSKWLVTSCVPRPHCHGPRCGMLLPMGCLGVGRQRPLVLRRPSSVPVLGLVGVRRQARDAAPQSLRQHRLAHRRQLPPGGRDHPTPVLRSSIVRNLIG